GCGRALDSPDRRFHPIFFRAGGAGMGPDRARVEDQDVQIRVAECGEDRVPAPLGCPTVEASPDTVPFAEPRGQILPRNARASHVQDRIDEQSIVLCDATMLSWLAG